MKHKKILVYRQVYAHWLPKYLGASAVTLGYTIYYDSASCLVPHWLRRHEKMHINQVYELGIIRFYTQYLMEYLSGRLRGKGHWEAYNDISFEIQARAAEKR